MTHFALPPDRTPKLVVSVVAVISTLLLGVWLASSSNTPPLVPAQPCAGGQPVGLVCQSSGLLYHCRQYKVIYWCPKDSER